MVAKNIHLVKAAFHSQFKVAMETCGVSSDHYFKEVNLPTEIQDPESLLPLLPFYSLINMVAINENIPDFGSQVAQITPVHKIDSLGPLIEGSSNLKELLETFCEIASSQSSPVIFSVKDEGPQFSFCYTNSMILRSDIQMELYRITSMIQLIHLAAGSQWRPETIRLVMPELDIVNANPILEDSEIRYAQKDSAISFEKEIMQLPVNIKNYKKNNLIQNPADLNIEFVKSIQQIIHSYSLSNQASIEEIAEAISLSPRSLQRRLATYGLKFNDLLSQAKSEHAKELLQNSQSRIADISKSLGYSDAAHFTRAFRRWNGLSPREYQKKYSNTAK